MMSNKTHRKSLTSKNDKPYKGFPSYREYYRETTLEPAKNLLVAITGTDFAAIGAEIGQLVEKKNKAYGNAFVRTADMMRVVFPDGIKPEQYLDAGIFFRMFDKIFRIVTEPDAFGESPYKDIAGYGICGTGVSQK